jgi:uncharacterized membrane protein
MRSPLIGGLGEKFLVFFEKIYLLLLDFLIAIAPFFIKLLKKIQDFDRKWIYQFFEKRGIDIKDYTIFKLQLSSAIFLILTTLFIINNIESRIYLWLGALLGIYISYLLFSPVKSEFKDSVAYRDFFLSYYLLAVLLAAIKVRKPFVNIGFPLFHLALGAVLGALIIYTYFNRKYSRDYTYGKVIDDRGIDLLVKLNYDLLSNIKPQTAILRKTMNARVGDTVKVRVSKGFMSLRGSRPIEITGVEWS